MHMCVSETRYFRSATELGFALESDQNYNDSAFFTMQCAIYYRVSCEHIIVKITFPIVSFTLTNNPAFGGTYIHCSCANLIEQYNSCLEFKGTVGTWSRKFRAWFCRIAFVRSSNCCMQFSRWIKRTLIKNRHFFTTHFLWILLITFCVSVDRSTNCHFHVDEIYSRCSWKSSHEIWYVNRDQWKESQSQAIKF